MKRSHTIALLIFLGLALIASSSGVAMAQTTSLTAGLQSTQSPGFFSCTFNGGSIGTCIVYAVTLDVATILGLFISLGAIVIKLGLAFNQGLYNSPFIQTGFGICLSIANLGFVLAIIVIAVATILRSESYGYKKALWRLIAMAILVNFGLVITAPIISFADSISTYFVNAVSGTVGAGGIEAFVDKTTGALQPQALLATPTPNSGQQCEYAANNTPFIGWLFPAEAVNAVCNKLTSSNNPSPADSFSQAILALVFQSIFLFFIALALFSIGALLMVRYAYLCVLLVLLPFAWLSWIFPKFNHEFSKWWSTFVKWVFFAPAAMFFIYLALLLASQPPNGATTGATAGANYLKTVGANANAGASVQNGGDPEGSVAAVIGKSVLVPGSNQSTSPLQAAEQDIVVIGLLLGGLMAASSLTGKAGSFVVAQAQGVSGAVQGYAGKQAKKGARAAYQGVGGDKLNAALRRSRIPFASTIGLKATDLTNKGGKDLVKQASTDLKLSERSDDELVDLAHGTRGNDNRLAVLGELQKRNKLDKIDKMDGKDLTTWLADNEQTFKGFGQGKLQNDINTALVSSNEMRRVAQVKAAAGAQTPTVDKYGIVDTAGTKISAGDLAGGARVVKKNAQERVDTLGANAIIDHHGRKVKAGDLVKEADNTIKEAQDLMDQKGDVANVADITGLLGPAGQTVKAGDLLRAASEKFWAGKDKGDVAKMKPETIFAGQAKFGLDANTIRALGKAITHGVATQTPTLVSSITGKLDSWKQLNTFVADYKKSIDDAMRAGKMSSGDRNKLSDAITKVLGNKLVVTSEEQNAAAQAGGAPATPPPATPPPAANH
jgi:hypothetical protein